MTNTEEFKEELHRHVVRLMNEMKELTLTDAAISACMNYFPHHKINVKLGEEVDGRIPVDFEMSRETYRLVFEEYLGHDPLPESMNEVNLEK